MTAPGRSSLTVFKDRDALARGAAALLLDSFRRGVSGRGHFTAVLSGGSTPVCLYRVLAAGAGDGLDWNKAHLFWGDERCVPPESPESNYHNAHRELISRIDIPAENIHRIRGEIDPGAAADEYERGLYAFFGMRPPARPPFDIVFLGLGADGHTLSLFPGTPALDEKERLVVANRVDGKPWRVTLTFGAIEGAERTVFLVSGADKAAVLRDALDGADIPAARVAGHEVLWLADRDAARLSGV